MATKPFPTPAGAIDGDEDMKTTATTEPTPSVVIKHQRDIPNGTEVPITVNGSRVMGVKVGYLADVDKCLVKYGPHTHRRKIHGFGAAAPRVAVAEEPATNGQSLSQNGQLVDGPAKPWQTGMVQEEEVPTSRFSVHERFQFIEEFADGVILGDANSLVVSGSGGLGKTYTILERLALAKKVSEDDVAPGKPYDYTMVKGFSTPKSMYRLLFNNKDKLVTFDDCDSVLDNPTAVNILKAALDDKKSRWVHWLSEKGFGGGEDEDDLPVRFEFTGKIIFISNRSLTQIDQAILSRCFYVDVTMTRQEKIDRIRELSGKMLPAMELEDKLEVVDLMDSLKEQIGDLNLRTFGKVCDIRRRSPNNWRNLAEYLVTANMGSK